MSSTACETGRAPEAGAGLASVMQTRPQIERRHSQARLHGEHAGNLLEPRSAAKSGSNGHHLVITFNFI